jgi:hypothetical protein
MGVTALTEPRFPHFEQTRRRCHSGTGVSAPYRRASSAGPVRPDVGNRGTRRLFVLGPPQSPEGRW